jgi:hypothetical protein
MDLERVYQFAEEKRELRERIETTQALIEGNEARDPFEWFGDVALRLSKIIEIESVSRGYPCSEIRIDFKERKLGTGINPSLNISCFRDRSLPEPYISQIGAFWSNDGEQVSTELLARSQIKRNYEEAQRVLGLLDETIREVEAVYANAE